MQTDARPGYTTPDSSKMRMTTEDDLFRLIQDLVMTHSPSGCESELDVVLRSRFELLGHSASCDPSGNLVVKIAGSGEGTLAITAHKDEIGATVTEVHDDGVVKVRKLGGSFPWVYGEGVVDLLGDSRCVSGVLSFGSRHVSHASPQHVHKEQAPLRWADAWVETKCTAQELAEAGVRAGTCMVVGKHRKAPFRMKDHIASYTLDNKASLAILLELAARIGKPRPDVYLIASSKEEVGGLGALYFTRRQEVDAIIALEICPLAPEYRINDGVAPVLLAADGEGLYDKGLNDIIRRAADQRGIPLQMGVLNSFGSDASLAMKQGHVPKAACLAFPTQNTHGYEIAHLGAIRNCIDVLQTVCSDRIS